MKHLFKQIFDRDYTRENYEEQFSVRAAKILDRLERIERVYREEAEVPEEFFEHLARQKQRLFDAQKEKGAEIISPFDFEI